MSWSSTESISSAAFYKMFGWLIKSDDDDSEWPKFSHLSRTVLNCKRLRSLPSVEAVQRLTNLEKLHLTDYTVLKERGIEQQSKDHDSERPKISHIPPYATTIIFHILF